jgi:hypothetical protein
MSFDNYKITNFEYNQPVFVEDLNSMVSNDILLYNKINSMPRGVLAYTEYQPYGQIIRTRGPLGSQVSLEGGVIGESASYTNLRLSSSSNNNKLLECNFDVENDRLIEMSTFLGHIGFTSLRSGETQGAVFALAFFLRNKNTLNSKWEFLNNSVSSRRFHYQSTSEVPRFTAGSISASYVTRLPAGSYGVRVGVTARNFPSGSLNGQERGIRIGYPPNSTGSIFVNSRVVNQLCIKDVGSATPLQGFS